MENFKNLLLNFGPIIHLNPIFTPFFRPFLPLICVSLKTNITNKNPCPKNMTYIKNIILYWWLEAEESGVCGLTVWCKTERSHPTSRSILSCFEGETSADSTSGWARWEPIWPGTETWASWCLTLQETNPKKGGSRDFIKLSKNGNCWNY